MPDGTFDPSVDLSPTFYGDPMPQEWAVQLDAIAPTLSTKVAEQQVQGETWYATLARTLPILTATYQQKQILDVQVERAKQGLPPLNASQFAAGVNVGASPELMRTILIGVAIIGGAIYLHKSS